LTIPLIGVLDVRADARKSPAHGLVWAGQPSTEHAGQLGGSITGTATQCPQSGFFRPQFAIFGQFSISFGLTPSNDPRVRRSSCKCASSAETRLVLREPSRLAVFRTSRLHLLRCRRTPCPVCNPSTPDEPPACRMASSPMSGEEDLSRRARLCLQPCSHLRLAKMAGDHHVRRESEGRMN
jgi:hypothetical protein